MTVTEDDNRGQESETPPFRSASGPPGLLGMCLLFSCLLPSCLLISGPPYFAEGEECDEDRECKEGLVCLRREDGSSSTCEKSGRCDRSSDCAEGEICAREWVSSLGECVSPECTGEGLECGGFGCDVALGACFTKCEPGMMPRFPCGPSFDCVQGTCVQTSPLECYPFGQDDYDGGCVVYCFSDTECAARNVCDYGDCHTLSEP